MCLVSHVPYGKGFIISSNRDESATRATAEIKVEEIANKIISYPSDTAGGSWLVMSNKKEAYCVLNGAFIRHERRLPYRISRGQMLKQSMRFRDSVEFIEDFDFYGIEPFTMVLRSQTLLLELRWDGQIKHIERLDKSLVYVWSSCTLYSHDVELMRKKWFFDGLELTKAGPDDILNLHANGGEMDLKNGFIMNRNGLVQTISISQVYQAGNKIVMKHKDLLTNQDFQQELSTVNH